MMITPLGILGMILFFVSVIHLPDTKTLFPRLILCVMLYFSIQCIIADLIVELKTKGLI